MQRQINYLWSGLIILAGLFCILYLGNVIFPGKINPAALRYFTIEQIQTARAYNFVPRLLYIISFVVQAAALIWFVSSSKGRALARWLEERSGGNFWAGALMYFFLLWLFLHLLKLPFNLYINYSWQHIWGFSTQSLGSWWQDYLKSTAIDLFLSASGVLLFFFILRHWPKFWWVIGGVFLAFWLVLQNLLWPVLIAPLFNNFVPVKDPAVIEIVTGLANKAGIQVKEVLVMDASQRTTMVNAYFTGLGKTKQIVVYDNLLHNYSPDKLSAILAHEIGHWQKGHIIKGLALGIVGNFLMWGLLVFFLRMFKQPDGSYLFQAWAGLQLFMMLVLFIMNPLQSYLSREMEKQADLFALELTGNSQAAVSMQIDLTIKNKADISPPDFIVWFQYTHPPVLSRLEILGG